MSCPHTSGQAEQLTIVANVASIGGGSLKVCEDVLGGLVAGSHCWKDNDADHHTHDMPHRAYAVQQRIYLCAEDVEESMTHQDRCRQCTDAFQLHLLMHSFCTFRTWSGQGQSRLQQGVIPVYTPSS